jgi:hypothetical protein
VVNQFERTGNQEGTVLANLDDDFRHVLSSFRTDRVRAVETMNWSDWAHDSPESFRIA